MKKLTLTLIMLMVLSLLAATGLAQETTATAKGFAGDVPVTLTIEDGAITAAKAEGANETAGIGTKAFENMPVAMVEQNSVTVDVVASATITSNAVLEAAKAALQAAGLVIQPGIYPGKQLILRHVRHLRACPRHAVCEPRCARRSHGSS